MLTTMMIVRIVMMMIALFAVFVAVSVMMVMMIRPGREWVGKAPPVLRSLAHLGIAQKAGINR